MLKNINITAEDVVNRLVLLPLPLRTAAESEENAKAIEAICREQGIVDEGKIVAVQQAFCFSLLGLVKPEEIGREIDALLDLKDPARAEKIATAGRAKVFTGLEPEIAKNYHPEILRISDEAPQAVDITSGVSTPPTPPLSSPVVIHREANIAPVAPIMDREARLPVGDLLAKKAPTPPPKPSEARLEIGKSTPGELSQPLGVVRTEVAPPRVVNYSQPAPAVESKGSAVSLGDITRRSVVAPAAVPPPASPQNSKTPSSVPGGFPVVPPPPPRRP